MLRAISMGKGSIEDLPDVYHVVHTDGKALEHSTAKDKQGQSGQAEGLQVIQTDSVGDTEADGVY